MGLLAGPVRRLALASTPSIPSGACSLLASTATTHLTSSSNPGRIPQLSRNNFATTSQAARQKPSHLTVPQELCPDYPLGDFRYYKQRNSGLFGGAKIRFGNSITGKKAKNRHPKKSPAIWRPNRHTKRLWSQCLEAFIRVRLTAPVLRTIDRMGGIDEYLMGPKMKRLKELGPAGWALRWKIMQTPNMAKRFAAEREALGLPPKSAQEEKEFMEQALMAEAVLTSEITGNSAVAGQHHQNVDSMIANEEEFVLGNPKEMGFMEEVPVEELEQQQSVVEEEEQSGAAKTSNAEVEEADKVAESITDSEKRKL